MGNAAYTHHSLLIMGPPYMRGTHGLLRSNAVTIVGSQIPLENIIAEAKSCCSFMGMQL